MNDCDVDVAGGSMRVVSFGTGPQAVLAVHGITANAMCWQAVARALADDWTLYAVDLRGRGHSTALPGPSGSTRTRATSVRSPPPCAWSNQS